MTQDDVVQTVYSPEGRPQYKQLFVDQDSEVVDYLNRLYLENDLDGDEFEDVAQEVPRAHRNTPGAIFGDEWDYPAVTEDGYRWQEEIIWKDSNWKKKLPLLDYDETVVLFPRKRSGTTPEEVKNADSTVLEALYIGRGMDPDKAKTKVEEQREASIEAVENNPELQDTHLDRSVAVYGTENVERNKVEEFLGGLADALEAQI